VSASVNDLAAWPWLGHQGSEYPPWGASGAPLAAAHLLALHDVPPLLRLEETPPSGRLHPLSARVCGRGLLIPALFWGARTNCRHDNWRFWIIHLWVEGFFELFATVLVAVMFVHMGLVRVKTATRLIYLDAILYLAGGIAGTAHHWYFTGQESIAIAVGACFSALEVVPLTP
jgi:nitric oxide reductase subunit B